MWLCLLALPAAASAQAPDTDAMAAQKAAIAQLSWMDGNWRGPAETVTPNGVHRVTQTERIGNLLGGTIKLLEGKGFTADGGTGFNAFGVVSYDPAKKAYSLHSYAQGREGSFVLVPRGTGYVWEIPAGPMTIRYTATLKDGLWTEVGDRVMPGKDPQRFFEMNLRRIGDSDWPVAGSLGPK
jgi:hypothetical protein